jgi:hypothetical protein
MILTVLHPCYFPPAHYFGKLFLSDKCVYANTFLFKKHDLINRCKIKTFSGAHWLTVPVKHITPPTRYIIDVEIDNHEGWRKKHTRAILSNYQNSPFFYYYFDKLTDIFSQPWRNLCELDLISVDFIMDRLNIQIPLIPATTLDMITDRTERIIEWLKKCHCDTYLLEDFEIPLINLTRISDAGFRIFQFSFLQQTYHQQYNEFIPSLSTLDLIFNEGDHARNNIQKSSRMTPVKVT